MSVATKVAGERELIEVRNLPELLGSAWDKARGAFVIVRAETVST